MNQFDVILGANYTKCVGDITSIRNKIKSFWEVELGINLLIKIVSMPIPIKFS